MCSRVQHFLLYIFMSIVSYHVCVRESVYPCVWFFFKSLKQYTNVYRLEIVLHIFETLMWLMCVLLKFNTPSQLACHPSRSFFSPSSQLHTNDSMNRLVVTGPLYDIRVQLHYWFCTQHWNIALLYRHCYAHWLPITEIQHHKRLW